MQGGPTTPHQEEGRQTGVTRACKKASDTPWSCRKIAWVRNGCPALAVRWNDNGTIARYKWGVGATRPCVSQRLNKCGWVQASRLDLHHAVGAPAA